MFVSVTFLWDKATILPILLVLPQQSTVVELKLLPSVSVSVNLIFNFEIVCQLVSNIVTQIQNRELSCRYVYNADIVVWVVTFGDWLVA